MSRRDFLFGIQKSAIVHNDFNKKVNIKTQKRIDVLTDTMEYANTFFPEFTKSVKVQFDDTKAIPLNHAHEQTAVTIDECETIDTGLHLKHLGFNPVIVCFGDDVYAGGFPGAVDQEETIFRRSDYFKTLLPNYYPLRDREAVYSPNVNIFKKAEKDNWELMDNAEQLAFIACPWIKYPVCANDRLSTVDTERLRVKINLVLLTASQHQHDSVVIGGYPADSLCPSQHVAEIFKEIADAYSGVFKQISFALTDVKCMKEVFFG